VFTQPDVSRYRQILPGLTYTDPPSQGKLDTLGAPAEALEEAVEHPVKQFAAREAVEVREDGMVALHNMRYKGLLSALNIGGLVWPSIAVIRSRGNAEPYTSFGNCTVVLKSGVITNSLPDAYLSGGGAGQTRVYGNDSWTFSLPGDAVQQIQDGREVVRIRNRWGGYQEYPNTLEGLSDLMRDTLYEWQEAVREETGEWYREDYGFPGKLESYAIKRYSDVEDIRADLVRLGTYEEQSNSEGDLYRAKRDLAWQLWHDHGGDEGLGDLRDFEQAFYRQLEKVGRKESPTSGVGGGYEWVDFNNDANSEDFDPSSEPDIFRFNGEAIKFTSEEVEQIGALLEQSRNVKTRYFEAKARRGVSTDEWAAIVLPAENDID